MKTLIWTLTGLLAALWTGLAWVMTEATAWLRRWVDEGTPADALPSLESLRLPAWVLDWVDVGTLQALLQAVVALLQQLRGAGPWLDDALAWLVPVVWGVWALGIVLLLGVAGALHLVLKVAAPSPAAAGVAPGAQGAAPGASSGAH